MATPACAWNTVPLKWAMKVLGVVVLGVSAICSAEATSAQNRTNSATNPIKAPPLECGVFAGRDGAAFGPGLSCQVNWNRFGFYGFAGQSNVNGYQTADGVTANLSDRTLGFGIDARIFRLNRFAFGIFCQAAYYGSKIHATYFDPDYQLTVDYRQSDREPLTTVGPEIRLRIANGVSGIIRPGKDFGRNFAATTAGGFSINGGVLVDVRAIGASIVQIKNLPHAFTRSNP